MLKLAVSVSFAGFKSSGTAGLIAAVKLLEPLIVGIVTVIGTFAVAPAAIAGMFADPRAGPDGPLRSRLPVVADDVAAPLFFNATVKVLGWFSVIVALFVSETTWISTAVARVRLLV